MDAQHAVSGRVAVKHARENSATASPRRRPTLVIFSQTFPPDPASVGQHTADVAIEMSRRGYRVRVFTSARGYENAAVRYPARQQIGGVEIRRLALGSLGKGSMLRRVLGTALFQLQCLVIGLCLGRIDALFFSTSPPLIGVVATIVGMIRGVPTAYWAMDLNPDQLIALGKLPASSLTARLLDAANRVILRRARLVVALDRFMAQRLTRRADLDGRLLIMPPWSHDEHLQADGDSAGQDNPFRIRHGLAGKFVVMYSGNHSPANPLSTLLAAAIQLKDRADMRFVFVGGGSGKAEVERVIAEQSPGNILSLPYQPFAELKHSLAAADVHVVALGQEMVGIIHPCKIYGAMAVARPVLYFGPRPSHITDLLDANHFGLQVSHGDVAGAVAAVLALHQESAEQLRAMGHRARQVIGARLSQQILCTQFCDAIERAVFTVGRSDDTSTAPDPGS